MDNSSLLSSASFQTAKHLLATTRIAEHVQVDTSARRPPALVTLTQDALVSEALQVLSDNRILSAPVLQDGLEFIGFIDTHDLLRGLIKHVYPELLEKEYVQQHESLSLMELQTIGPEYLKQPVTKYMHDGDLWYRHDANSTLLDICREGFRLAMPTRVHHPRAHLRVQHRVGVFDIVPGEHDTPDGRIPRWRITNVLSQSDVLRLLVQHAPQLDPYFHNTLQELGLLSHAPVCVPGSTPAIAVLATMYRTHISGVAITDDQGKLIGNLSVSDVRGLRAQRFGALCLPVAEFVAVASQQSGTAWDDVLFGKHLPGVAEQDWAAVLQHRPMVCCPPTATLLQAMQAMDAARVHRCYVVDAQEHPVGVVSISDVLRRVVQ